MDDDHNTLIIPKKTDEDSADGIEESLRELQRKGEFSATDANRIRQILGLGDGETLPQVTPPPPPPPPPPVYEPSSLSPPAPRASAALPWKWVAVAAILGICALLFVMIIIGAMTGPAPQPQSNTSLQVPEKEVITPSPTVTVPAGQEVYLQIAKDPASAKTSVIFEGGPGEKMLRQVQIRLTTSDGQVVEESLKPERLSTVTLQGSRGTDRIEVFLSYYSGITYKIEDRELPYYRRGG